MKASPWLFGMVFLGFFCYVGWNNMQLPTIFLGKSVQTDAILVDYNLVPGLTGRGSVQIGTLAFGVEDSLHIVRTRLDPKSGYQSIGSKILIEYSDSNPSRYRIEGYYKFAGRCLERKYSEVINGVQSEVNICNGVLAIKNSKLDGEKLDADYMACQIVGDTVKVGPLLNPELRFESRYFINELTEDLVYLVDLTNGNEYRK